MLDVYFVKAPNCEIREYSRACPRHIRMAIAARDGAILPIFDDMDMIERCVLERHVSIDTTASGGNVSLLAGSSS